jgi:hypothetical protein
VSKRHTIGWLAAYAASAEKFVDRLPAAVAKVEVENRRHSVWLSGGGVVSEPIFVPRTTVGCSRSYTIRLPTHPMSRRSTRATSRQGPSSARGSITTCPRRSTVHLHPGKGSSQADDGRSTAQEQIEALGRKLGEIWQKSMRNNNLSLEARSSLTCR